MLFGIKHQFSSHLGFPSQDYLYFGTKLDTQEKLNGVTGNKVPQLAEMATQFAGHVALRLVHDHLLRMDLAKYDKLIRIQVAQINAKVNNVQRVGVQCFLADLN